MKSASSSSDKFQEIHLKQLLTNFLHVGWYDNKKALAEAYKDVTITKPIVGNNATIPVNILRKQY